MTWSCLGFLSELVPTSTYPCLKVDSKLTFEDHVSGIVSCVSQRIGMLRLVKRIFVCTSMLLLCHFSFNLAILEYCSPLLGQPFNITLSFLSARCIRAGFDPIRVSCRVIDLVWLGLVCCARLIRSLITVCPASFHLLLLEFDILVLWQQLNHWRLKYQGVEPPNLLGISCRLRFECGITFLTLFFTPVRWMVQVCSQLLVASLSCVFFLPWRRCTSVAKAIYKQLCFSLGPCCWY